MKMKLQNICVVNKKDVTLSSDKWKDYYWYIGRPSLLGNPFVMNSIFSREEVVEAYKVHLLQAMKNPNHSITKEMRRLWRIWHTYGQLVLVCYCAPLACHGDIIKEVLEQYKIGSHCK